MPKQTPDQAPLHALALALVQALSQPVEPQEAPQPAPQPVEPPTAAPELQQPKRYISEAELRERYFGGVSKAAWRQRPGKGKPPAIVLSPRKRIYDVVDVEAWLAAQPRNK